jgi:hypothetical protein
VIDVACRVQVDDPRANVIEPYLRHALRHVEVTYPSREGEAILW